MGITCKPQGSKNTWELPVKHISAVKTPGITWKITHQFMMVRGLVSRHSDNLPVDSGWTVRTPRQKLTHSLLIAICLTTLTTSPQKGCHGYNSWSETLTKNLCNDLLDS